MHGSLGKFSSGLRSRRHTPQQAGSLASPCELGLGRPAGLQADTTPTNRLAQPSTCAATGGDMANTMHPELASFPRRLRRRNPAHPQLLRRPALIRQGGHHQRQAEAPFEQRSRALTAMPWSRAHAQTSPLRCRPADVRPDGADIRGNPPKRGDMRVYQCLSRAHCGARIMSQGGWLAVRTSVRRAYRVGGKSSARCGTPPAGAGQVRRARRTPSARERQQRRAGRPCSTPAPPQLQPGRPSAPTLADAGSALLATRRSPSVTGGSHPWHILCTQSRRASP